ncbi:MAG: P-loop NTPase [Candidatus Aenigmarchaeota archaeon]|nr:P-loop NTPase [Candidatus Aenigmarchaeota archaeon]
MTKVIGVTSGKGGVGKTTIVSNLGVILSKYFNKNVTIVDCNVTNSHLALYFGMYYFPVTINKVIREGINIEEAMYKHYTGVNIVPASLSLSGLRGVDVIKIKDVIQPLREKNDLIILDGSPGMGRESMAMLHACDKVLFVTNPIMSSMIDVVRFREVLNELNKEALGLIINMRQGMKNEMGNDEIEKFTEMDVISSIPYDKNVYKSLTVGSPVFLSRPDTRASKEFLKVAHWLVGEEYQEGGILNFLQKFSIKNIFQNLS